MRNQISIICKHLTIILFVLALVIPSQMNAVTVDKKKKYKNGRGLGSDNGATKVHSAFVNKNNNGKAGEGNKGKGVGNMPYGNQGKNGNPNGRTGERSTSIPLDGGLGILVLGAAAFGIRKLRNNRNDKD